MEGPKTKRQQLSAPRRSLPLQILRRSLLLLGLHGTDDGDGCGAFAADGSHEVSGQMMGFSQELQGLAARWFGRR